MDEKNGTGQRIYECAVRILEAEGPQAVTMRRVATEAGITAMAIYHYFPNREALLNCVVDSEFQKLAGYVSRLNRELTFEGSMLHVMDGYVDYGLAHPRIFDYVFAAPRPGARRYPADFRGRKSPTLNLTADTVSFWMERGELKLDDPWEIAMELWAHVHGYLALWRGGRFDLTEDEFRKLVHRSLGRLLYGLAR